MDRYVTRRNVATSWEDAVKAADADQTPRSQIKHTANVTLIHRTDFWAFWSDCKLTRSNGLPPELTASQLSAELEELIDIALESDPKGSQFKWSSLLRIQQIHQWEILAVAGTDQYTLPETLEKLTIQYTDDSWGQLYILSAGDLEDYMYRLHETSSFQQDFQGSIIVNVPLLITQHQAYELSFRCGNQQVRFPRKARRRFSSLEQRNERQTSQVHS